MRFLGIDHAYQMGASIGGGLVIDFALEHPEMVDALIPVVSGLSGGPEPTEEELRQYQEIERVIDAAREAGNLDLIDEITTRLWVDGPTRMPEQVDPAVRARVLAMLRDNRDAEGDGTVVRLDPPASGRLGDIHVPTLAIAGEVDVPDDHGEHGPHRRGHTGGAEGGHARRRARTEHGAAGGIQPARPRLLARGGRGIIE